jgi:hypothetical protein
MPSVYFQLRAASWFRPLSFDVRLLMRWAIGVTLALLSGLSAATTCIRIIPEAFANATSAQISEAFLREDFERSTVVFEGSVLSIKSMPRYSIATVQADRHWKSDGRLVQSIFLPAGPCNPIVQAGGHYIFLARRAEGLLPHVKSGGEPLALVSSLPIDGESQSTRQFLSSLAVIAVRVLK